MNRLSTKTCLFGVTIITAFSAVLNTYVLNIGPYLGRGTIRVTVGICYLLENDLTALAYTAFSMSIPNESYQYPGVCYSCYMNSAFIIIVSNQHAHPMQCSTNNDPKIPVYRSNSVAIRQHNPMFCLALFIVYHTKHPKFPHPSSVGIIETQHTMPEFKWLG